MRRAARLLGTLMIAAGMASLAWAGVTWAWEDPITTVYTRLEQRELTQRYEERLERFALPAFAPAAQGPATLTEQQASRLRSVAARYRKSLKRGDAIGRLRVPRLDLEMMIVQGTDDDSLKKGPGHYGKSRLPGEGHLIYVAGHRTTYSAPFSRIDRLRTGDLVVVELPYGTFEYRVTRDVIVENDAVEVLESRGREEIALQACHPRFFASHRYIVYAEPVRVLLGEAEFAYA